MGECKDKNIRFLIYEFTGYKIGEIKQTNKKKTNNFRPAKFHKLQAQFVEKMQKVIS